MRTLHRKSAEGAEALDGVKSVVMSLEEGTATVELEEGAGGEALRAAVEEAGYKVKGIS